MSHFSERKMLGILFACGSYGLYSLHYATMKWLGGSYSLWQLIFIRSLVMFAVTVAFGRMGTIRAFVASPYKLPTAVRSMLQFLSALCFYFAAQVMPLGEVTTIYSVAPLMIVVLSIIVLNERISGLSWIAVIFGLAGAVIAANPGHTASLLPAINSLGSALLWAFTVVFTRKSGGRESSSVQMFTNGLVFMALSAPFMSWQSPESLRDLGLMILLGLEICVAQYFFFEACRFAPASIVGPMEYTSVAWACALGFFLFADIPTVNVFVGALMVVVSGVAVALSSRREARRMARTSALAEPL